MYSICRLILLIVMGVFMIQSLKAAEVIVDIPKIAGESPDVVKAVLGAPTKSEKTQRGPKLTYQNGRVEVVYIGGKADWMTVNKMEKVEWSHEAISALGFSSSKPTFSNKFVLRWDGIGDTVSVSIFELRGQVDYAYVQVNTK